MAIWNVIETVNQSNADVLARSGILTSTLHNVLNGTAVPAVAT